MKNANTPMEFIQKLLENNSTEAFAIAAGIATVAFFVFISIRGFINTRLRKLADRTSLGWDDLLVEVLGGTYGWMLFLFAVLIGAQYIEFSDKIETRLGQALMALVFLQIGFWLSSGVAYSLKKKAARHEANNEGASATAIAVAGFTIRLVLWSIVVILVLDQFGFNVTTLIASLGVGGVAVALAVQNILGDLFASLSIALDKPFVIGDFIIVGDVTGTVEHVGLKTTRIRALSGEQIVVSNGDLLSSRIHNYKRLRERRIVFQFGVLYDTPADLLESIPGMVKSIIESTDNTRFDRAHFFSFGASSLDFEVVYYVTSDNYTTYMDAQQRINLAMVRQFGDKDIGFAFPTRTLHLESVPKGFGAVEPPAGDKDSPSEDTPRKAPSAAQAEPS
ncbi:mechanosensitive ion channel family protein [Nitrogeniibacter aestuarii]|uniref:mechanosensitive ion channel family protein n=1 Tax=Nitrogeniibacter aestuarii TaxID=2815343 RepID=UPI001E5568D5|nr:mechanosensitive ion channel family protein [Nitrogeniibacter aestuarii]